MLEYGIKAITTNPTLVTKASEIIKLVDTRSKQTRAFVLPAHYAPLVEKLAKELEAQQWAIEKKRQLAGAASATDELDAIMHTGMQSIRNYLEEH